MNDPIPFPGLGTADYTEMKKAGRLIAELGDVIIKQYGEKESVALLKKFKDVEKKKQDSKKESGSV